MNPDLPIGSLPDTAILRLIEVSMEEMLLFESKHKIPDALTTHPLNDCQLLKVQLQKFLLTQYGLANLADSYLTQILKKIGSHAQLGENKYAQVIQWILQEQNTFLKCVAQNMSECFGSQPLPGLNIDKWIISK